MHNKYLVTDEWKIIEDRWNPSLHQGSESLFSIGNGFMGQRANFEESYSGQSLQGSYLGGVYYPDKTRVGWWKNGYPEYFAKVLNSVNWIGIRFRVDGVELDLAQLKVLDFYRELNMKEGHLLRRFKVEIREGLTFEAEVCRFISMKRKEIGAISYQFKIKGGDVPVEIIPYLDFDVENHDSNYDEKFWEGLEENVATQKAVIKARTRKLDFQVAAAMRYELYHNESAPLPLYPEESTRDKYAENAFTLQAKAGEKYSLYKYAAICSSFHYPKDSLVAKADELASQARRDGFKTLWAEQKADWQQRWEQSDISIEGDAEAQQGIRFNIFHLSQTYTGEDARLNIGPKGFTGEKYGGSTYWDTEAYCLPFYMASAGKEVARNLLVYRYNHLEKAIENAAKLGFSNGAALYPMVTMNGEECHNEWEITFEEIHRNGAIAFGIYNYVRYFGDEAYLAEYGLEVLMAIARFWAQRFNWSESKKQYVMLGVTGPNEYENNVNNNWYTNYLAKWCIEYAAEVYARVAEMDPAALQRIVAKTGFNAEGELKQWQEISSNVYFPVNEELGIVLQQEGYLDKEQRMADDLELSERPINQHWSWDRILRSCFIKQADVLQGFYFFEDHFSKEELERNFDFYEPRTVHESSLSPCVHVVQAAYLGKMDKAYEMYLRTSRLDLDDYNREVHEGLHITSMAGTWMSVVEGFGGMRVRNGQLHFNPRLPEHWKSLAFKINFRNSVLKIRLSSQDHAIEKLSGDSVEVVVHGETISL
ncbi:family 65 glycosyl hydrolase domain-containing protein [Croceimicrobium hydrocarbonivorans]|uniref:Glycoside hydrolase family 65 protein n=1 Tax=Croceimicrobium hydrocarbonivorans TaxID=2761580 RepID=A0A7H0VIS7_9FLAO|nr:family 65 glycosyl hydrolase domain-containing protein [Croceimicrobium hydrocarbonivorans]QNR25625.1 glycoside hydrolase family 65 protein [Croceimicrobium hydrocarbonivorans]